jgi:hypothetical protein
MAHIIQVRCNGPDHDVNEVDVDQFIEPVVTAAFRISVGVSGRSTESPAKEPPERIVLPCQHCTVGKVIITREMIKSVKTHKRT